MPKPKPVPIPLRLRLGARISDGFFEVAGRLGRLHPDSNPARHGVERVRDLSYAGSGLADHRLDLFRPAGPGPFPVCLYVHGGAFRSLSKETHWLMGLIFARRGFLTAVVNYRLAPRHPFPAALEDLATAYAWLLSEAPAYGGDLDRLVLAGESAGANLVTALALLASYPRPEPFARPMWEAAVRPRAVVAACGMFQVSDGARFGRRRRLPGWLSDQLVAVERFYLPPGTPPDEAELADPLLILERGERPERPLPPFVLTVGTADPLLDDTRRLAAALEALGVEVAARYYPGEVHAFQALVFRPAARRAWADTFAFLEEVLGPVAPAPGVRASG